MLSRITKLAEETTIDLRAFAQSRLDEDDGEPQPSAVLTLAAPSGDTVAAAASKLWELEGSQDGEASFGAADGDDGSSSMYGDDDAVDDDVVTFADRLLFADALEHAWLTMQSRHISAIRAGLRKVSRRPCCRWMSAHAAMVDNRLITR